MVLQGVRIVALTLVLVACYAIGAAVSGLASVAQSDAASSALPMLVMAGWMTATLSYVILRARRGGWALVAAVFVASFGLNTFLPQVESLLFLNRQLPAGMVPRLLLSGVVVAGLFAPAAVAGLKRLGSKVPDDEPRRAPSISPQGWAWRLGGLAVAYAVLYLVFGYFVAWQNPVVREYYDGVTPESFLMHLAFLATDRPGVVLLQLGRGLAFVVLVIPAVRLFQRAPLESGLAVALLFTMGASQLLLPNAYMPEAVRHIHLLEIVSSNAVFGALVGWVLADALGRSPRRRANAAAH